MLSSLAAGVCAPGDEAGTCANVSALIAPFYPMTFGKLPNLGLLCLSVWATLFLIMLRRRKAGADHQYEQRRARAMLDAVGQVCHEHAGNEVKRAEYNERERKLRAAAAEAAKKAGRPAADVFDELFSSTGLVAVEVPSRLTAERVLSALMDEAGERVDLNSSAKLLEPRMRDDFQRYVCDAHALLLERCACTLEETVAAAQRFGANRKPSPKDKAELTDALTVAKKAHALFHKRRAYGLLAPRAVPTPPPLEPEEPDEEADKKKNEDEVKSKESEDKPKPKPPPPRTAPRGPKESMELELRLYDGRKEVCNTGFAPALAKAKAELKRIKKHDDSRLAKLLSTFSMSTLGWLGMRFVCELGYASFGPLNTLVLSKMADDAHSTEWQERTKHHLLILFVIFAVEWYMIDWIRIISEQSARQDFQYKLRSQLFNAMMRQDKASLDKNGYRELMRTLDGDAREVVHKLLFLPLRIFGNFSGMIGQASVLFYKCPGMLQRAGVMALAGVPVIIGMQKLVQYLHRRNDRIMKVSRQRVNEMLGNLATVRMFSRENQEEVEFDRQERRQAAMDVVQNIIGMSQWTVIVQFIKVGEYWNFWYGAGLVYAGMLSSADFIMLSHQVGGICFRFKEVVTLIPELGEVLMPADRVFTLLETESLIEPMPGDAKATFETKDGGVELVFDNVSFAYPTMLEHKVLRNVNLRIPAGKTVAFVGERGCGKSTCFELLQRSYDPIEGRVIVNGRPMAEWDVRSFRRKLSVVSQQVNLFTATIKENLLYGLDDAERLARGFDGPRAQTDGARALQTLCEAACCWDFIKEFPLRFETKIGENGVKLSGGQTQCIAIARAMIKHPAMLLLDEATSALDATNQKLVAENIAKEQKRLGFSLVQIAHRLETLATSDVVYFLVHGRIVEEAHTEDGSACEQLRKAKIEYQAVENPETKKTEQKLKSGHFHHLWNVGHDIKDFNDMDRKALHARIKELEADLKAHTEAVAHKDRIAQFRLKLRSVTHFVSHGKLEDAEFTSVQARDRINEIRKAKLLGDDDAPPSPPLLDRARTVF